MESKTDKSVALLSLLRQSAGGQSGGESSRVHLATVDSESPPTLVLEGVDEALDIEIFEVPEMYLPLTIGSTYFALPMAGDSEAPKWALIQQVKQGGGTGG